MKTLSLIVIILLLMSSTLYAHNSSRKLETKVIGNADFKVVLTQKTTATHGAQKAILILPPTGGKNVIDINYAKYFYNHGFDSFILTNWTDDDEYSLDFDIHNRYTARAQKALFMTLKHLHDLGYDIQILATSAGGFNANIAMGNPKIVDYVSSYMTIVSGSPLCSSIATAGEKTLAEGRFIRMKIFKLRSIKDYEDTLCDALDWNIPKNRPKEIRFGIIRSTDDKTVLSRYQKQLSDNWQPDFIRTSKRGHIGTVFKAYFRHRDEILKFFQNKYTTSSNKPF